MSPIFYRDVHNILLVLRKPGSLKFELNCLTAHSLQTPAPCHTNLAIADIKVDTSTINKPGMMLLLHFVFSFHLDHCGALPWFLEKTAFRGRCFMTHATKAIYRWLLSDYVKVR